MENIESYKYTKDNISDLFKDDLKKHYLKRNSVGLVSVGEINEYKSSESIIEEEPEKNNKKIKFKYKFATKLVGSLAIVALVLGYK